ncbi:MAG: NAD(P)H-hydrate dehydratase [Candidatus Diapherotrites archaeon]
MKKLFRVFSKYKRKKSSHKGENGKSLVIGGSKFFSGAPALAAVSALRVGVDLSCVVSLEKPGWVISKYSPDIVVHKLSGSNWSYSHVSKLLTLSKNFDAVLIGNGLGSGKGVKALVSNFVSKCSLPLVIDADALRFCKNFVFKQRPILTPHLHEFFELSGFDLSKKTLKEKVFVVKKYAFVHNCVVLLKGKFDVVSDGCRVFVNKTGCSAMTKAGTGDVLAGLCLGLLALDFEPFESACFGAYVNGKAGESLFKLKGYSFFASELAEQVGLELKKFFC